MKPEYTEGTEATSNFEEGMKAIFKVSKAEVVRRVARPFAFCAKAGDSSGVIAGTPQGLSRPFTL